MHCNTLQRTATGKKTNGEASGVEVEEESPFKRGEWGGGHTRELARARDTETLTHSLSHTHTLTPVRAADPFGRQSSAAVVAAAAAAAALASAGGMLQHAASHCNTLLHTAAQCILPQHIAAQCNTV